MDFETFSSSFISSHLATSSLQFTHFREFLHLIENFFVFKSSLDQFCSSYFVIFFYCFIQHFSLCKVRKFLLIHLILIVFDFFIRWKFVHICIFYKMRQKSKRICKMSRLEKWIIEGRKKREWNVSKLQI